MNKRQGNIIFRLLFAGLLLVNGAAMAQRAEDQHVSVGGKVFGGGKKANVSGSSTVMIDQTGAIVGSDVYGGGEMAKVNTTDGSSLTNGKSTNVTLRQGTVQGSLYGGGLGVRPSGDDPGTPADVFGPVQVTINGGTVVGNVFGCNNLFGAPQTTVVVDVLKDPSNVTMSLQNVYGGGNQADYSNSGNDYPEVNIKHGTVGGSVFGGGLGVTATVTGNPQVTIGDNVENHTAIVSSKVYGGGDEAAVIGSTTVTVQNAHSQVGVDVYGGGNQADVSNSTTVHINDGTIGQDVYGGGAFAHVGTDGDDNTTVNVLGGTVTRDVYGGGLGRKEEGQQGETGYVEPIAAVVNGVVTVNIGFGTENTTTHFANDDVVGSATIGGSVFGCNNANGTPKDNVTVNIFQTAHSTKNEANYHHNDSTFAIYQVFGGGNQAHYLPLSNDKKTTVHVWTCNNTIEYLYGGGNAADVGNSTTSSADTVIIDGGRIGWVFGGGNGAGQDNPGANIFGDVTVTYHAGDLVYLFGGSNEKGNISGVKTVDVLSDGQCVYDNHIAELYGGNNMAPATGDVTLTMDCPDAGSYPCTINYLFGGSRKANITGNVVLTVNGGLYDYVFGGNNEAGTITGDVTLNLFGGTINEAAFGGNNLGGAINGKVTVNMLDQGPCPLIVHNIYGGGNLAAYHPTTVGAYPEVNLIHGTVSKKSDDTGGNVFGGGLGSTATITANPIVNGGYDASMATLVGTLLPSGISLATANVSVAGNVYGGGDEAGVVGSTTINIQEVPSSSGISATTTVGNDVYGGGNLADVSGSTTVNVTGGTVTQDVYGGGALAHVGTNSSDNTTVTLSGGTVRDIYGGGLGDSGHEAEVNGAVLVTVNGGTVRDVFGCNNFNGAPTSTVQVNINNNVSRNVYGGGNLAAYTGTPDVNINSGTVSGSVFGGGNQAGVGGGDVTMTDGNVLVGLYGGCNTSGNVGGNIAVNVNGGTIGADGTPANVHGGGYGSSTTTSGNVVVNIAQEGATTGPTIWGDVYGGSALGNVNTASNTTTVTLNKGTINGDLYGGGLGDSGHPAAVNGAVQVTVNAGTVTGSVYGCNNVNGAPQGTVNVDIYGTDTPVSGYALGHVFGGGNAANYNGKPVVKVHNCSNSIEYVYGGGNAATVKGTDVTIYGGNTIGNVFGGCYGANVTDNGTDVKIYGGTILKVFGGNNQSGTITGPIQVNVNKQTESGHASCPMMIEEVYGGGNVAASNAGTITIGCTGDLVTLGENQHYGVDQEGIRYVYGGANQANITSNITLNIISGIVENVFGGNNQSGNISGTIQVNINKNNSATCAEHWYVGNVYGGGNVAAYSAPSGSLKYPEVNLLNGTVSHDVFGGGLGEQARVTGNPVVNINGGTVSGKTFGGGSAAPVTGNPTVNAYKGTAAYVYGGGLGSTAIVTGNPSVLVDQASGQTLTVTDVFGGGDAAGVTGNTTVQLKAGTVTRAFGGGNVADITGTTTVSLQGATATNIYGGGNEANVSGTTSVSVSNGSISGGGGVYGGCNTKGNVGGKITVEVTGGTIGADGNPSSVFGGGYGGYDDNAHPGTSTSGDVEVTINGASAVIWGDVYGGSAKGSVNTDDSNETNVTLTSGTIHGDLYGGGLGDSGHAAAVNGAVQVTVNGGTVTNVFGCNNVNGAPQSTVQVNINNNVANNVYGGGNEAAYDGTPDVNIIAGTVSGRVFGGGNNIADDPVTGDHLGVTGSDVEMTGGIVLGGIYGGCNQQGAVTTNSVVKIYGGTLGSHDLLYATTPTPVNVFGGGLGEDTYVNGNVTVTVDKGAGVSTAPIIWGDVYGGSALGSVNTNDGNTTIVNILDGTLKSNPEQLLIPGTDDRYYYIYHGGNVFGGGLGESGISNVDKGKVNGVVTVNIGTFTANAVPTTEGDHTGNSYSGNATIEGNVYGCNNTNGSPQQDVTVNIYHTAHNEGPDGFAIANVFGGGNLADYLVGKTATVNVFGCDNTIERSFGGGNAAATNSVVTDILGGRFAEVYGGGNGEVSAANIFDNVTLGIHGGTVGQFFVGSNQNGSISGTSSVTVDNDGCDQFYIDEFFCGGNYANINGDVITTITCEDGMNIGDLYGGCNMADITGRVELNVYGGTYRNIYGGSKGAEHSGDPTPFLTPYDDYADIGESVTLNIYGGTVGSSSVEGNIYGGSNINGRIGSDVTVTVEDHGGDCALDMAYANVYGGGNLAVYTAPTTSGARDYNPMVYINNATVKNVYGAGKGDPADNTQYKGSVAGNPKVIFGDLTVGHESYESVALGNIYGGGNAARVDGSTTVLMQKSNSAVALDIYGGGNLANVSGSTTVDVTGGTVTQDVYGGGALADVNITNGAHTSGTTTTVTLTGGTVRDIYGGGLGSRESGNVVEAKVFGPVQVTVNGGTVQNVFGCNNENGAPQSTVQVDINNNVANNVYGGGNQAAYSNSGNNYPVVNINNGTVANVFGGGLGSTAVVTANPQVTIGDSNDSHNAIVTGNVYGGGDAAAVAGSTTVTYNDNGSTSQVSNVFGGGNQAGVSGTATVTVTLGQVTTGIYGGCNTSGNVGGNIAVNVTGGTIGANGTSANVHGGGYGNGTSTDGDVEVTINGASAVIWGDVYGGSAKGHVNSDANDNTTVTLTSGTIHGDLYGGGLGDDTYAALVNGAVQVTVNGGTVTGSVFGCNNANGAPQSTVNVDIYGTDEAASGSYALGAVFGGGNLAAYSYTPNVTIHNCDNSIGYVYGGGNKASVAATNVVVYGGHTIGYVFGGGNGEGVAANYMMVSGNATTYIYGGEISHVFGGNNSSGTINGSVSLNVNKQAEGTGTACDMKIGELYGGGNEADGNAGTITIGCTGTLTDDHSTHPENIGTSLEGIGYVYGGANMANIGTSTNPSNITLNMNDGIVGNVFGGNNMSGDIHGTITVNIEKTGTCGWYVGNVFGGGNLAAYTGNPAVNIKNGKVSGNVYGGGNGDPTSTTQLPGSTAAPTVIVGDLTTGHESYKAEILGDVYGGGNAAKVTGSDAPTVQVLHKCNTEIGYVYGGGNAADVPATNVSIEGGWIHYDVFGGGHGDNTPGSEKAANVEGNVVVSVTGAKIDRVFAGSNLNGAIGGTSSLDINKTGSCDMKIGEVYGGGNQAAGNAGTITIGCTGDWTTTGEYNHTNHNNSNNRIGYELEGIGTVYGGANQANIGTTSNHSDITLNINNGMVENVFGGNNTSGDIYGTITVNINRSRTCDWYVGDVYGGGNHAAYNDTPHVNIINGTVSGNVYGGGNDITSDSPSNPAGVAGSDVEMTGGEVLGGIYGGCNLKGTVTGDSEVNILGGTIGSQALLNAGTTADVFGGGLGANTMVNGDVTVTITRATGTNAPETPTIYGDVYGGSALGSVNSTSSNTTTVHILDGTLETHRTSETLNGQTIYYYTGGNVYGGGLGDATHAAVVKGVVTVNIGSGVVSQETGFSTETSGEATIKGNVYGCNNANGSPEQNVTVNVYKTAHIAGVNEVGDSGYAIANVFGGGNEADYTATGKTAQVNVYGCDNTIERIFGGGNAAAAPHVVTFIQGGRFSQVFGGGNGERGASYGADVTDGISIDIHGGNVGQFYGGSNQNGTISGAISINVVNDGPCEDMTITEFFCGGNFVDIHGDLVTTISCSEGMNVTSLYGGCNQANIYGNVILNLCGGNYTNVFGGSKGVAGGISADIVDNPATSGVKEGNVTLNLYGGTIENVFGGSNIHGNIENTITVNVLDVESPTCPLYITNIYGGSNLTDYVPDSLNHQPITDPNRISPVVNVVHAKYGISGNVYGGSKGNVNATTPTKVMANPLVNIGYVSGMAGYNLPTGSMSYTVPAQPRAIVAGSVFGGGDAAEIQGNTEIQLRNRAKVLGNVYGGGNMGEVKDNPNTTTVEGNTKVIVDGANQ